MENWNLPDLASGLIAGALVSAVLVGVALARGAPRPVPIGGIAFALAGLVAVHRAGALGAEVVVGVVGVGVVCGIPSLSRTATGLLTLPFGLLVASGGEIVGPTWLRVLAPVAIAVAAPALGAFDDAWRSSELAPPLLAISCVGVVLAVPDTERAMALLGVAVVAALVARPLRVATLGDPGAGAAVALFVWVASVEGRARPSSVVAAVACLAVPVAAGAVAGLRGQAPRGSLTSHRRVGGLGLTAGHLLLVAVAARVAGLRSSVGEAVAVCAVVVIAASLLALASSPDHAAGGAGPIRTGRRR